MRGRRITLTDGSAIVVENLGLGSGETLAVTASESVEIFGTDPFGSSSTGLFTGTINGNGGNLTINTKRLFVRDGGFVSTNTYPSYEGTVFTTTLSKGNAGGLNVNALYVELSGTSPSGQFPSGLFS